MNKKQIEKVIEELKAKWEELDKMETNYVMLDRILEDNVIRVKDEIEPIFKSNIDTGCKNIVKYRLKAERKGNSVICTITSLDGKRILGEGISKCNKNDTFDDRIGFQLAQVRARTDWHKRSEKSFMTRHKLI